MPYNYITSSGTIVPDTSTTKQNVEDEYKALFGADLIIDDESPEGLIINAEVEQRDNLATNNATVANQLNPNLAEGVFLDSIFSFTAGERQDGLPSTFSTPPTITGVAGTNIPIGSRAQTVDGDIFETTSAAVIGSGGTVDVAFQSIENAEIQVAPGELNQILDEVLGWESVTNSVAASPGRGTQSDQQARIFRRETLALQGISAVEAIFSNVRSVSNVQSLTFRDNPYNSTAVIDGITLPGSASYACVDGGLDNEIALALLSSKTQGSPWHNGESSNPVSASATDPTSGQVYNVLFDRPDDIPTAANFTVSAGPSVDDPEQAVKDAVIAYASGNIDGEQGFTVGADVSPFELAGAITVLNPEIIVRQVLVTKVVDANPQPVTIPIELFEKASIQTSNISVTTV